MKVKQIYKKYGVPENLQQHMIRVAKVAEFIVNHWKGVELDDKRLIKLCLLHDLGNIVRIDLNNFKYIKLNEKEKQTLLQKKLEMVNKYGSDDHEATAKMLNEVVNDQVFSNTILAMAFVNS